MITPPSMLKLMGRGLPGMAKRAGVQGAKATRRGYSAGRGGSFLDEADMAAKSLVGEASDAEEFILNSLLGRGSYKAGKVVGSTHQQLLTNPVAGTLAAAAGGGALGLLLAKLFDGGGSQAQLTDEELEELLRMLQGS